MVVECTCCGRQFDFDINGNICPACGNQEDICDKCGNDLDTKEECKKGICNKCAAKK